jgi:hypothetical protein
MAGMPSGAQQQSVAPDASEPGTATGGTVRIGIGGYPEGHGHIDPELIERTAFLAREDKRIDRRSGVSQRMPITVLENVVSNAERIIAAAGRWEPTRGVAMQKIMQENLSWRGARHPWLEREEAFLLELGSDRTVFACRSPSCSYGSADNEASWTDLAGLPRLAACSWKRRRTACVQAAAVATLGQQEQEGASLLFPGP